MVAEKFNYEQTDLGTAIFIDDPGKYTKNNFTLVISEDVSTFPWELSAEDGDRIPKLNVTAWEPNPGLGIKNQMCDIHITVYFEELNTILEEESESDMYYYGELSMTELGNKLIELGFKVLYS